MYVYCVESFAHIVCYGDCSRRGAIWLNPFAMVLFSAITVECCVLCPCCMGVFGIFAVFLKEDLLKSSKILYTIDENKDIRKCNKNSNIHKLTAEKYAFE